LVQILEPHEGMSVYDPCAGSGGMLIHSKNYVQEIGEDGRNLALAGQESNGGTWSICKMNMILHGIRSADIRQGDTIKDPQHLDQNGEIKRFDRVIANPPFSQNYTRQNMKYPERFHTFMPESGKKADLMFVQHMAASIKSNGKLAVVMPHGVLFRGGDEKACRKRFIQDGVLEAVVGLPSSLFYGTGIPASVLIINKDGANKRKEILFINADREYKEGKNQNSLRPEDIEKITHVYHKKLEVPKYSRFVPVSEIEQENFNLNIRRYVDNSPPPEPHDVKAHLRGGVPNSEITALQGYFDNYPGIRDQLFIPRDPNYSDFASSIESKEQIKALIESNESVVAKHAAFHAAMDKWWKANVTLIENLPTTQNVFELRRRFMDSIAKALLPHGMLGLHQIRGCLAAYMNQLYADFKSIAASGWGAELIPEEEILASQFPEVLEQAEKDRARISELEALFATANEEDAEVDEESGVLPAAQVKALKDEKRDHDAVVKDRLKQLKSLISDLYIVLKTDGKAPNGHGKGYFTEGLTDKEPDFSVTDRILAIAGTNGRYSSFVNQIQTCKEDGIKAKRAFLDILERLKKHSDLDDDLKSLKGDLRQLDKEQENLVQSARAKIIEPEARKLILERFRRMLIGQFDGYLSKYQQSFINCIEDIWIKYAVTMKQILSERNRHTEQLNHFLQELGYE
jgi:type I restriction enzyme M protein